ncbi:MAG: T9SS type A sorting domain-containing protein [Bacteroidetes bacterium]|nr:T9SS type A sorting domain-containing protein [Bacteroidota bacterium]
MARLISFIFLFISVSLYGQDVVPPVLTGIVLNPSTANATAGPDTVEVTITATDENSGLKSFTITFSSPSESQLAYGFALFEDGVLTGSATCKVEIKEFSESGIWDIKSIYLFDQADNNREYNHSVLQLLGYKQQLIVYSNQDIVGPMLTNLTIDPVTIDVRQAADTAAFSLTSTDNLSGLLSGIIAFKSPTNVHQVSANIQFEKGSLSGTREGVFIFEKYCEAGIWIIDFIKLVDVIGNQTELTVFDIHFWGFPDTITVYSVQDITPPALTYFARTPGEINGAIGADTIICIFTATDDISGLLRVSITVSPPEGYDYVVGYSFFEKGTLSGTVSFNFTIDQFSKLGVYTIHDIYLTDVAGNENIIQKDSLTAHGFPTFINVVDNVPQNLTDIQIEQLPHGFSLSQNYPNPFNPNTTIVYDIPEYSNIEISLYNALGKKMKLLYKGNKNAGRHKLKIDATDLSSGVYFYELISNDFRDVKKCLLIR